MEIRAAHDFRTRFSRAILEAFQYSKWVMQHTVGKPQILLSNDIKLAQIGVRTKKLWLPEVGSSELFLCVFPANIPVKRGMPPANRELHVVAGVVIFPTHPGPHVNLLRVGKTLCAKATVREENHVPSESLRCLLLQGSGFMGIRPWVREIWFHEQGPRGVFGPFEDSFPIVIPARPGKILAIREFHVMHECVFFPTCPGSRINSLRVRKTLRASVATSALHRGELGFARYDLANRGRWSVPHAKGFDHNSLVSRPFLARKVSNRSSHHVLQNGQGAVSSIQLSVWSMVRSNLGQTWSNLVKILLTLGNVSWAAFRGLSGIVGPSRVRNGLVKPWSNLVNSGQTWSTLVKLGQILGNVFPDPVLRLFGVMSPRRIRPTWFGLSSFCVPTPEKIPGVKMGL
uniref:Uncharacterized protein n=1 Tax=Fagus sylvatica TaxID=28930 RepID=A0A2N9H4A8_FAGSY